ncbi:host-nuclease inhibitor Gam family protein [Paenibacillus polymyxa]|uniref:Host-nuclease inhibitor Gam family protein n=1 Tax=Paenibacillus polymyxa TaxID=1406 RepID=A0A8I1J1Y4_PAEPO|nr:MULTISPECIES: host-nuclease inhibitor Gam family protein [Paenibacillus]KAF6576540.1 host-nuclease inhibitor Gam family protein [Paenibacillus sp. EKM206P]KAF6591326.1 host-nuclease inhibitor Gam family protein [Paenibacillus sp. EKM205P]MBM0632016.1 host-nuclease inhibitor Gam family protein [Paenibacillus polymyxa]
MSNLLNPLFQAELDELDQQEQEERQRFVVDSLDSLTWVMRKLVALEKQRKEVNAVADAEVYRIESYRKTEMEKAQRDEDYFRGLLSEYAARRREEDPKFKSVKTPYGSVSLKKQQPKWNYDDQALTSWLNDNGYDHLIRVKWEPVKTDIKKAFSVSDAGVVVDPNGEPVEGIQVEHRGDELGRCKAC